MSVWFLLLPVLYLLLLLGLYLLQARLVFHPTSNDFFICPEILSIGGIPVSKTVEGIEIRYYLREQIGAENILIHFHGNGGSACERAYLMKELLDLPVDLIFVEHPGYAGTPGSLTQKYYLAYADKVFRTVSSLPENAQKSILLFGESLGTGIATWLACKYKISGLVLQAPYTSMSDIAAHRFPLIPARAIIKNPFPASTWARSVKCPVLAFHSESDHVIPYSIGVLQSRNFSNLYRFESFQNAGHNDFYTADKEKYLDLLKTFIFDVMV